MPSGQRKLLVDTDIGSNIDDAACLAYLLKQPRCKLAGITTVTGEPMKRAKLASAICEAFGAGDIPIHPGVEQPLLVPQSQPTAPQAKVLQDWDHRNDLDSNTAVRFMRQVIRESPGEITLLTIGPLTNVGLLFALDPEIPKLLDRLIIMGGCFDGSVKETNASTDPHSTAIVYNAEVPELLTVSLDVTRECSTDRGEARNFFDRKEFPVIREMAEVWFGKRDHITFHDPLAAAVIFEPQLCTYETGRVTIELCSEGKVGETYWNNAAEAESSHEIARSVEVEKFFSHYRRTLGLS